MKRNAAYAVAAVVMALTLAAGIEVCTLRGSQVRKLVAVLVMLGLLASCSTHKVADPVAKKRATVTIGGAY
jgi:hypothetical protein